MSRTVKELRNLSKDFLAYCLSKSYYCIDEIFAFDDLTEDEKSLVYQYIDQYAKTMCKAIGKKYYNV